jgi:integrase|tara:strand:+ start:206 stop:1528 length:1323 start_codon:yes stop_codon:yes gene_type:complete
MGKIFDSSILGLKEGKRKSERLDDGGSLVIWHKKRKLKGIKEFYFRKINPSGSETNVKIGVYPSICLVEARAKAKELSKKASTCSDLKFQLAEDERIRFEEESAKKSARQRLDNLGTLSQLCEVYRDKMKSEDKSSYEKVYAALQRYVLKPYPYLANKKANLINANDVKLVLKAMYDRGITTTINRVRGDLHAAFNVGLTYDHDITIQRTDNLCFDISTNPAAKVKKIKQFERALTRFLSPEELRIVWGACGDYMNPVYASLLKVMICTGFHATELMRLTINDVQHEDQAIYMIKTKTGMPNLIPLNRFAWQEIQNRIVESGNSELLFPTRVSNPKGDIYDRASVLANQVAELRSNLTIEHFTPRDFRRTVKTLMGKAGISKEMRDRLQNHAVQDVSGKHYDKYDYLPEKRAAMKTWERWLAKYVVEPELEHPKVVPITG